MNNKTLAYFGLMVITLITCTTFLLNLPEKETPKENKGYYMVDLEGVEPLELIQIVKDNTTNRAINELFYKGVTEQEQKDLLKLQYLINNMDINLKIYE